LSITQKCMRTAERNPVNGGMGGRPNYGKHKLRGTRVYRTCNEGESEIVLQYVSRHRERCADVHEAIQPTAKRSEAVFSIAPRPDGIEVGNEWETQEKRHLQMWHLPNLPNWEESLVSLPTTAGCLRALLRFEVEAWPSNSAAEGLGSRG